MSPSLLLVFFLGLSAVAFHFGRRKALGLGRSSGSLRNLHSRPVYYGVLTALWCGLPAILFFVLWQILEPTVIIPLVISSLPDEISSLPTDSLGPLPTLYVFSHLY